MLSTHMSETNIEYDNQIEAYRLKQQIAYKKLIAKELQTFFEIIVTMDHTLEHFKRYFYDIYSQNLISEIELLHRSFDNIIINFNQLRDREVLNEKLVKDSIKSCKDICNQLLEDQALLSKACYDLYVIPLIDNFWSFKNELEKMINDYKKVIKNAETSAANHTSLFAHLPQEIINNEIAPKLDKSALLNVSLTAKRNYYQLFQQPLEATKLLDFVKKADYVEAEKIVSAAPKLMFQSVKDGTETTTPLKFAFKLLDTYMWKMFLEKILCHPIFLLPTLPDDTAKYKNQHLWVAQQLYFVNASGEINKAIIQNPHYLKAFLKQAEDQQEHIDLTVLFKAYKQNEFMGRLSKDVFDVCWNEIGTKQRNLLPQHMVKEFCRQGTLWYSKSKFDINLYPPPSRARAHDWVINDYVFILPAENDYTLLRGEKFPEKVTAWDMRLLYAHKRNDVDYDCKTLEHLYEIRKNDLKLLSRKLVPENTRSAINAP